MVTPVKCKECGKPMNVRGHVEPDDEFTCNECYQKIKAHTPHPALSGDPIEMQRLLAEQAAKAPPAVWVTRPDLWGSKGFLLVTMHRTPTGFLPGCELIEGVNEEDARAKMMNRVRNLCEDPNCVRIVMGIALQEMRRAEPVSSGGSSSKPTRGDRIKPGSSEKSAPRTKCGWREILPRSS